MAINLKGPYGPEDIMKLEITKEKVLAAAAKCSTAKATLQTLFPEVFEEDKYLDLGGQYKSSVSSLVCVRGNGEFKNKGWYLNSGYNWEIIKDSEGFRVLVPTKRK